MKVKKLKYLLLSAAVLVLAISASANATTPTINSVDGTDTEQNVYSYDEDVYVSGYCTSVEEERDVDLYVVKDKDAYVDGDALLDVTGSGPTTVFINMMGQVPLTKVWANPLTSGTYDIVLDANQNGTWEPEENCVDDFDEIGFTVGEGSASAATGSNNPGDHTWGEGEGEPNNVMLQFAITANPAEGVNVSNIQLTASGTGDETTGISNVIIAEDTNGNGLYEATTDTLWGQGTYAADNGILNIATSEVVPPNTTKTLIVVYVMTSTNTAGDTYSFSVTDISAIGDASLQPITVANLPINSGTKTIVEIPEDAECGGSVALTLTPDTTTPETTVEAEVTGLSNCAGETVDIIKDSCDGELIDSCTVGIAGCSIDFTAPAELGTYDYYACLDINEDSDFDDIGEQESATLTVQESTDTDDQDQDPDDDTGDEDIAEPFEDIDGHWAEEYINDLREKGIISGKSEGIFMPDALITRAELTKIALLAFGFEVPESVDEKPFPDVEINAWYARYIAAAEINGVVDGYPDGTFMPNQVINRVEALKVLLEAARLDLDSAPTATFPDTEADAWYSKYINYAIQYAIVSGYSSGEDEGNFGPANNITRAEVAKITSLLLTPR